MKLLLSAAVAVVILFYSFSPALIYSPSTCFSSTVHKSYMFLLCHGILVLIVQKSRLISYFPVDSGCGEAMTAENGNREKTMPPSWETMEMPKEVIKAVVRIEDVEETENGLPSSPRAEEIEVLIEQDGEEEMGLILSEEQEEEWKDEREDVAGMMSREELNKKCDDFISKMKEAIHREMHQLILT